MKHPFTLVALITLVSAFLVIPAQSREMEEYPVVKLQSLEKTTARTVTFEANVGSTVRFGTLYIKIQTCRKAPPIEQPESAAFLQIWEEGAQENAEWIFSGWMFSSSPGLSSMDHPLYDVWVLDCLEEKGHRAEDMPPSDANARGEGELDEEIAPPEPDIETTP